MPDYLEFEVSLRDVAPRIWRRFLIRKTATFLDLHNAIQDACGWWDCHLWAFQADGEPVAGPPDSDDPDARRVKLSSVFREAGDACSYDYDFGDSWEHDVVLTGVKRMQDTFKRRLLDGERAFPKEDSGGIPGYERFVELLATGKDPYGEDPEELLAWLEGWTPDAFDARKRAESFDR